MPIITLKDAAHYVKTSKVSELLLTVLGAVKTIFTFRQERNNRINRYVLITREYAKGTKVADIIDQQGCSRQTVLRYARLAGLEKRPKHFPDEVRKGVIADYKAGLSVAEIAMLNNVSPAYVSKVAREEGISRYAPRPKKRK